MWTDARDLRLERVDTRKGCQTRWVGKLSQGEVGIYLNLTLSREEVRSRSFYAYVPRSATSVLI